MRKPATPDPSAEELLAEIEALRRENAKLRTIRDALVRQADGGHDLWGKAQKLFQPAGEIERSVEKRIQRLAQAMSEARIARRQLQQAIDSIGEGFILYDRDDRIVLCNRRYRQIFPELEDLLVPGTHFQDVINRAAATSVIAEAVTDPQAWIAARVAYHRSDHCQFEQLLSDGRWIQISERATDDGGKVTIVSDITHFKRLEETRRLNRTASQSDLLATTVASIAQGVMVFDSRLMLVTWNSQAAMLLNLPYVDLHAGIRFGRLLRLVWRHGGSMPGARLHDVRHWVRDVKKRYPLRVELSYPGGRVVSANFRSMPDDGFVVTMTDVTQQITAAKLLERSNEELERRVQERTSELVRLNEILQDEVLRHEKTAAALERTRKAAEAANLSKTRFLAAASHDLLQPLNAARLYLTALDTSPFVAPGGREMVEKITLAFQSTEAILSTILDISKMDAGGYQPKVTLIDTRQLFRSLEAEFDALARQNRIELRVVKSSLTVRSDAQLLHRILQNLLSNAIKYTEAGKVLLGARRRGNVVTIEVHDTGIGIAPEHAETIFEEFKRVAPASRSAPGLGLGLAIVRRAAHLLGHDITLRSEVGRGSCFAVCVPVAQRDGTQTTASVVPFEAERTPARPPNGADGPDGCLVVLENDETVAQAMTTLFEHWQMKSVTAPSYPQLLDLVQRRAIVPRAIIADLHLDGDVDGIDAIILLREHFGSDLPAILITADQSRVVKDRARSRQIEYFAKPVKPAQLRAYLFNLSNDASGFDLPAMPGA